MYNFLLDFSNNTTRSFPFRREIYQMAYSSGRWVVRKCDTRHDCSKVENISDYYENPEKMIREVRIEGLTIKEIIEHCEYDMYHFFRYTYNYEKFLADIRRRIEYEFSFRNHEYYIDYWGKDPQATWIPGWIFTNDNGKTLAVNERNFEEFIGKVNNWMAEHEGVTLEDMFDKFYKDDNTGDLQIGMINGIGHQGLGDDGS